MGSSAQRTRQRAGAGGGYAYGAKWSVGFDFGAGLLHRGNMPATKLPLLLSPGWQMVPPRSVGVPLLWQAGAKLVCSQTDFAEPMTLGEVGLVDCPVAFDPGRGLAYGYASPQGRQWRISANCGPGTWSRGRAAGCFGSGSTSGPCGCCVTCRFC